MTRCLEPAPKSEFHGSIGRRRFVARLSAAVATGFTGLPRCAPATLRDANTNSIQYDGMEDSAAWRYEALARIELHRKGVLNLRVCDRQGAAIVNAGVSAKLYRHDFGFGASVRLNRLLTERSSRIAPDQYREICATSFHKLTAENAFKWKFIGRNRQLIGPFLDWCDENHLPVRGHCLVWPGFDRIPAELAEYRNRPGDLRTLISDYVRELATVFRDRLAEWDVLNEPFAEHEFMDILGKNEAIEWFRIAAKASPEVKRYINDYGVLTRSSKRRQNFYFSYIQWLIENGTPVQGVGFQSHTPARYAPTAPEQLFSTMDRFDQLGLDQQVTEFDFETDDEELQARYTQDFLIAIFSHPSMTGLINWTPFEYGDAAVSKPSAAMYDRNLRPKSNAVVWNELVNSRWASTISTNTDNRGGAVLSGFKGTYRVAIVASGVREVRYLPINDKPGEVAEICLS